MYPSTSLFIAVGQLAIAILVMFSYPLQVHPCRNCLDKVFNAGHVQYKRVPAADGETEEEELVDDHGGSPDMSPLKHTILTIAIVTSGFCIAYFVDDLQMGVYLYSIRCIGQFSRWRFCRFRILQCCPSWDLLGRRQFHLFCRDFSIGRQVHPFGCLCTRAGSLTRFKRSCHETILLRTKHCRSVHWRWPSTELVYSSFGECLVVVS